MNTVHTWHVALVDDGGRTSCATARPRSQQRVYLQQAARHSGHPLGAARAASAGRHRIGAFSVARAARARPFVTGAKWRGERDVGHTERFRESCFAESRAMTARGRPVGCEGVLSGGALPAARVARRARARTKRRLSSPGVYANRIGAMRTYPTPRAVEAPRRRVGGTTTAS